MATFPAFGELHIISDLHLGGDTEQRQIFRQSQELSDLVNFLLQKQSLPQPQGLVINGDLVDFLAQPDATYFDADNAEMQLGKIIKAFPQVWTALRQFVAASGRQLVIVLGNHDLELALPWVRDALLRELTGGDETRRARVTLVFEGSGFRCTVGGATVLCVHGNEVDAWNVTDHESLRRVARDCSRGLPYRGWTPNAGSKLVIDVMNPIKRDYPFVDLLKPETRAVVPTLVALDPKKLATVKTIAPAARLFRDRFRMSAQLLGADDAAPADSTGAEDELEPVLRGAFQISPVGGEDVTAEALLEAAERRFRDNENPYSMLSGARRQMLGWEEAFWSLFRRKPVAEVLFHALEGLKKDRSFDPFHRDATANDLDALVSPDIDFLLAGHTHLERALKRQRKTSAGKDTFYYNTGTWARLMRYDQATLGHYPQFAAVFDTLRNTADGMAALDRHLNLVIYRPTVVTINNEDGRVTGRLRHVEGTSLVDVQGSLFERT